MKEFSKEEIISDKELEALEDLVEVIGKADSEKKIVKSDYSEDLENLKKKIKEEANEK